MIFGINLMFDRACVAFRGGINPAHIHRFCRGFSWHSRCYENLSIRFNRTTHNIMNVIHQNIPLPDVATVEPDLKMIGGWEASEMSDVIRAKSSHQETPAFLFLGKREADFLTNHLAEVFGPESVSTLHQTYYMGLDVIVLDCDSFVYAGGRKTARTLQDPMSRRPQWRDRSSDGLWQLRL